MSSIETDVLVIGSGFGAAPPALRLAQAGRKVLVVEKGRNIVPSRDYRETQDAAYFQDLYRNVDGKGFGITYAEQFGGGSGVYLGISLRAPSAIFDDRDYDENRFWPDAATDILGNRGFSREVLDPFYERAEQMLGVRQIEERDVSKNGQLFALMMQRLGYSVDRTRLAVSEGCRKCGYCVAGCHSGHKNSLHMNYLPAALSAGAAVETDLEAVAITPIDNVGGYQLDRMRYRVICRGTGARKGEWIHIRAKVVVVAGGVVGSAKLLLESRELGRLSSLVGRRVTGNLFFVQLALLPETIQYDGEMFQGYGLPGTVSFEFFVRHRMMIIPYKALPIQAFSRIRFGHRSDDGKLAYWGPEHVQLMKKFRRRVVVLTATALLRSYAHMRMNGGNVELRLDRPPRLEDYAETVQGRLKEILSENGCTLLDSEQINREGDPYDSLHFVTTHPAGSCRIGTDISSGVVDANCEVFNYPGLFVTDASAIPSPTVVPPSLTIAAVAEKAAECIAERMNA